MRQPISNSLLKGPTEILADFSPYLGIFYQAYTRYHAEYTVSYKCNGHIFMTEFFEVQNVLEYSTIKKHVSR